MSQNQQIKYVSSSIKDTYFILKENVLTFISESQIADHNFIISVLKRIIKTRIDEYITPCIIALKGYLQSRKNEKDEILINLETLNKEFIKIKEMYINLTLKKKDSTLTIDKLRKNKEKIQNVKYGDTIDFPSIMDCLNYLLTETKTLEMKAEKESST